MILNFIVDQAGQLMNMFGSFHILNFLGLNICKNEVVQIVLTLLLINIIMSKIFTHKGYIMPKAVKTPASVLQSLMDEYQLNPFSLSKAISLNYQTVRLLVAGKSKVTIPTALRLAKFFSQSPDLWLDLQREVDLSEAGRDKELQDALKGISKAKEPAPIKQKTTEKASKKTTLSDKRKSAAKAPGAKSARGESPKTAIKRKKV
jgi:addiction module HigA family antidote